MTASTATKKTSPAARNDVERRLPAAASIEEVDAAVEAAAKRAPRRSRAGRR